MCVKSLLCLAHSDLCSQFMNARAASPRDNQRDQVFQMQDSTLGGRWEG